ncbi:MAG: ABC transporter ATP-binding protein [Thermoleophilia bacterium]|nr:ABC transporter ATP-binding protein [Thermoleophilia bacterium]
MNAIFTSALTKRYGDVTAVDDLGLKVERGETYGFLGRNGAGKTTTIRMLLGLIRPDAGTVEILGSRVAPGATRFLAKVGYLVETATAYPNLTVRENLEIQRQLTGAPRSSVSEAMELMRLGACADRRAGVLSLGNRQRLSLARALLHHPELLILDEPANGLDPAGIVEIRELLRDLATRQGVTVFISSHILSEVALLADRIGIVHEGRLMEEMSPERLDERESRYIDVATSSPELAAASLAHAGFDHIERIGPHVRVYAAGHHVPAIARRLLETGTDFSGIAPVEEDLEARFLRLTGGLT